MRQLNTQEIKTVAGASGCYSPCHATVSKSAMQCMTDFFYYMCSPKVSCAPAPKPACEPKPTCAPKPSCGTPAPAPAPAPTPDN
jgi:hypothetical protein